MRKYIYLILIFAVFTGCSKRNKTYTEDKIRNELTELYEDGYSMKELSLRTNYQESELVDFIHGESMSNKYFNEIDKIYRLDKKDDIIPIVRVKKSASNCLWEIYTKAQNLPILSQYTNVGVSSVANSLTIHKSLEKEDSLKILISYVNMNYKLDTIPLHINVRPYYHYNNEGISNLNLPAKYSRKELSSEAMARVSYYLWSAEELEKEANSKLELAINNKIKNFSQKSANDFMEKDFHGKWNRFKCWFKSDKSTEEFFKKKFIDHFNVNQLSSNLREEILSYCISINCSRILAINEVLNYDKMVDNLNIAQKVNLQKFMVNMENINKTIHNENLYNAKETIKDAGDVAIISLSAPVVTISGGTSLPLSAIAMQGFNAVINTSMVNDITDYGFNRLMGKNADVKTQINDFSNYIYGQIRNRISSQLKRQGRDYYKTALDKNTTDYYNQIRRDLNIK